VPVAEPANADACPHLVLAWRNNTLPPAPEGWVLKARLRRPGERSVQTLVYGRTER
jgi:predicted RNA polymerase sigma factor